ncbi:MAG TPA: 16S rRNA (cytidine(1402)-2'-O)-methyltransferase [Thermomicrobiales bacterium]|nr:16S rRNA (cytidine(1402)-2'-O)-methyltransferase [Thermomicrobiales bacterium]
MGTLYVVATPIGNLQDLTPRAVETLRSVSLIAAEDTRHSGTLLKAYGIGTRMVSYHHHNRSQRESQLLRELEAGDVALISDAGTPGIADPGREIVEAARQAGHRTVPIPGASSVVAAVSASGLVEGPFIFLGFLTRKGEERRAELGKAAASGWPLVLFESPVRLAATLADLHAAVGDREATVARELTKLHEELVTDSLQALRDRYAGQEVRGEIVIVVGPAAAGGIGGTDVRALARRLLADGIKPSKAAREVAAIAGIPGDEAYALVREVSTERD